MALLYGIRSEPKTALFGSRPLKNANGRVPRFAEKGVGVYLLLELIARGENRLFSPVKSGRFVFAEQKKGPVRNSGQVTIQVFRLRRKTAQKQKEIASGRNNLIRSESRLARRESRPL